MTFFEVGKYKKRAFKKTFMKRTSSLIRLYSFLTGNYLNLHQIDFQFCQLSMLSLNGRGGLNLLTFEVFFYVSIFAQFVQTA
jgi:hypothetical protein